MRQRGMHLKAMHMGADAKASLVAADGFHHRRLANNRCGGAWQVAGHFRDHIRGTEAANLFVIRQRDLQGPFHPTLQRPRHGGQRQRVKALHIAGATAKQLAVFFRQGERIGVPILPDHRYHIGMTRQDHAAFDLGADIGIETGLGFIGVIDTVRLHPMPGQIVLHPINQRQVRSCADGGKSHKFFKNLSCGVSLSHDALRFRGHGAG